MKFHCHRPSLAAAFGIVGGVVPARTPKPMLQNIRLTAEGNSLTLSGTDSEIGVTYTVEGVTVDQPGEILLPAQRASTILRELTQEQVTIESNEGTITISSGQSEFRLASEDPSGFPTLEDFNEDSYFIIPAQVLRETIRRTSFAADTESTRYALGGVLVEPSETGLTFAATDSRRLAVCELTCERQGEPGGGPTSGAVVPIKALNIIERTLANLGEEDVAWLALRNNDVLIRCGAGMVISRLVEGRFPKYRQVIPAESPIEIAMVVGEFLTAIKQSLILTSDESRGVGFTFDEGTLTLQSQFQSVGESKIAIPIDYNGEPLTITFDPKFMADVLRVLDSVTSFTMHLTDPDTQVVMRIGSGYTYVIMPLSRNQA